MQLMTETRVVIVVLVGLLPCKYLFCYKKESRWWFCLPNLAMIWQIWKILLHLCNKKCYTICRMGHQISTWTKIFFVLLDKRSSKHNKQYHIWVTTICPKFFILLKVVAISWLHNLFPSNLQLPIFSPSQTWYKWI